MPSVLFFGPAPTLAFGKRRQPQASLPSSGDPSDSRQAIDGREIVLEQPNKFQPTTADSFANVSARTLLMRAADTHIVMSQVVDLLSTAFPDWQLIEVPDGGHMAPMTRADAVNALIASLLDVPQ